MVISLQNTMDIPIVVDLDGTLIHSDVLHESALRLLSSHPIKFLGLPLQLLAGKAYLKQYLARNTDINAEHLPYNSELLDWLRSEKEKGRKIVLCTASNSDIALKTASYLGIFDEVIASSQTENLQGLAKAQRLQDRFGLKGFDYVGNAKPDLAVWQVSRQAVMVNASNVLQRRAKACFDVVKVFAAPSTGFKDYLRMLRCHQWVKNTLLFTPVLASHEIANLQYWLPLLLAFIAFSLCASAVYITNDLLDLEADRIHQRKRHRPFASGRIPIWQGVIFAPTLFVGSIVLASLMNIHFLGWIVAYLLLTTVYTLIFKRLVLLDCVTLAVLYTLRIVAGAAAVDLSVSFWLIALSIFLFLSLAFVKRYAELKNHKSENKQQLSGRGYFVADAPLVQMLGVASGYLAVLVLVLYLDSPAVVKLYQFPEIIWGAILAMLFWVNWVWLKSHRGEMHDDPLVFAVKDKVSLSAGVIFAISVVLATTGVSFIWVA